MEPIENVQEEIVTVEPGEETKSVEEEIKDVTPEEEVTDGEKEETTEEVVEDTEETSEEKKEEENQDNTDAEESAKEESEKQEKEKPEEKVEEESSEEKPEEDKEEPDKEEAPEEEEKSEEDAPEESELDKVKAELEAMKDAEETRKMIADRDETIEKATKEYDTFNNNLKNAILDTFKQYGIDPNVDIEELKKDPAKYQIAQDIVMNAQRIQQEKQAELMKPITDKSNAIVFREAGRVMAEFDLTEEQTKVCAETLINIFDATGLTNLTDDLRAKVELAVARAKMIAPKVEKVVEEVKEIVEDTKEAVKDVIAEEASEEEKQEDKTEEVDKEPEAVEEKPSIEAFKEDAAVGSANAALGDGVTVDNVLEKLASLPFKERTRFLVEHADLVDQAGRKRRAEGK